MPVILNPGKPGGARTGGAHDSRSWPQCCPRPQGAGQQPPGVPVTLPPPAHGCITWSPIPCYGSSSNVSSSTGHEDVNGSSDIGIGKAPPVTPEAYAEMTRAPVTTLVEAVEGGKCQFSNRAEARKKQNLVL